jgi:hypothetical protein
VPTFGLYQGTTSVVPDDTKFVSGHDFSHADDTKFVSGHDFSRDATTPNSYQGTTSVVPTIMVGTKGFSPCSALQLGIYS